MSLCPLVLWGKEGACICVMNIPLLLVAPDTCLHTPGTQQTGSDDTPEPARESRALVQDGGPPAAPCPCFLLPTSWGHSVGLDTGAIGA